MRQPIITTGERFDIDSIRPDIEAIVQAFDSYLEDSPYRSGRTMHSLLGPVPMILDGARVRRESAATLLGRAVRAHEMNPRARGYMPPTALQALEEATQKLLDLCTKVPITAVTKVTERIRYSVYYERRKKAIEWMAQTHREFIDFLKQKYADDADYASAWGEPKLTLEGAPYPSKSNEAYRTAKGTRKDDIDAFFEQRGIDEAPADEEEDENA